MRFWKATLPLVVGLAIMLPQVAAAQVPGELSCRASAVRIEVAGATVFEPVVANDPSEPCVTDMAGAGTIVLPDGLGTLEVLTVETQRDTDTARARSMVADVVLTVPGLPEIQAELLWARAAVCDGAHLVGRSRVVGLQIGGGPVIDTVRHEHIDLGAARLHLNEQIRERDPVTGERTLTQRAFWLEVPALDMEIVISEAVADL